MNRTIDITDFAPITVSKLEIDSWLVDLNAEKVIATIQEVDDLGVLFRTFEITFWATIPQMPEIFDYTDPENPIPFDPPQYEAIPETWYALPADKIIELIDLSDEILVAVKGRLYS